MLPALFGGELARPFTGFGSKAAARRFVRVIELLLRGAMRPFHNELNLPFLESIVNDGNRGGEGRNAAKEAAVQKIVGRASSLSPSSPTLSAIASVAEDWHRRMRFALRIVAVMSVY